MIHVGIKKADNMIIVRAKPSIPRIILIFIELNQELVSIN
jgi:hypothetical protein